MNQLIVVSLATAIILVLAFFVLRFFREARKLRTRYSGIIEFEAELTKVRNKVEEAKRDQQEFDSENQLRRAKLGEEYQSALATYTQLKKEISLLEENLEDIDLAPIFWTRS